MASVASSGTSPLSGYEFPQATESSAGDRDENLWTLVPVPNSSSSGPSSAGFFPSPSTSGGRLGSPWGIVGPDGHLQPSPTAASPLSLNLESFDQHAGYLASSYLHQSSSGPYGATQAADSHFMPDPLVQHDGQDLFTSGELMSDQQLNELNDLLAAHDTDLLALFQQQPIPMGGGGGMDNNQPLPNFEFDIPQHLRSAADVAPWTGAQPVFVMEDPSTISPSPPAQRYSPSSISSPSVVSVSPQPSPVHVKREPGLFPDRKPPTATTTTTPPITIRKVRDNNTRVSKKKSSPAASEPSSSLSSSSGSSSTNSKFFIVTPDSVNAHADRPNPFECFEAMRPSQRGRKGPLADETKESALQVRRQGACFCCHARKVKCDKERPCRNCKKLTLQVPGVVCWRFQDFLPVLFPEFIRFHFRKDEMAKFIAENIADFKISGTDKPCTVQLFSGTRFRATLSLKANFFSPKTDEVLQHWHLTAGRSNTVDLQARNSVPIGLDLDGVSSATNTTTQKQQQRDELRKKTREYINAIVREPGYAELVTDSLRHTQIPRKILRIVQDYSSSCDAPMVRRALSIYAMHFVMTRHLCLTRQTIDTLTPSLSPDIRNAAFVTPRVLSRQIKSVIDEMMAREMTLLFENFSKSLKPKSRKEWAPCMAAFLVLCLFMESVEAAADTFVMSDNEINLRKRGVPAMSRQNALTVNKELENLPFKQFAFQFHQIYQTHSRDAASRSFNPLLDDGCLEELTGAGGGDDKGVAGRAALEMIWKLRRFVDEPDLWSELDFLTADFTLPNVEQHAYPRDVSYEYTGRLVSKFLLSFTDEKYLF